MKYLSLFSGIGGFELGIQQAYEYNANRGKERGVEADTQGNEGQGFLAKAGKDTSSKKGRTSERPSDIADQRPLCIGYSEIDKYATQIYQKHFPKHKNYEDITKIKEDELPDFDLLVGGFPCQSFSIAGKRGGFDDTRGTLFFDIARILRAKKPRLLLLENVKGLLSHDEGRTFATIISTLDELGYDLQWQVLNSKNFGVPQNRERVFIVGNLRGTPRPKVFPFTGTDEEDTRIVGQDVAYTIDANYHKGTNTLNKSRRSLVQIGIVGKDSEATRIYSTDGISRTIKNGGGMGAKTGLYETPKGYKCSKCGGEDKETHGLYCQEEFNGVRRLTPLECERLQGFPDKWTEGISDTQRYKCCGNAVTVNVVSEIIKKIL